MRRYSDMTVTLFTNFWAVTYHISTAGKYRHVSLFLLDGNMAEGEDGGRIRELSLLLWFELS